MNLKGEYMEQSVKKAEYNKEPVFYCKHCLSLRVRGIPGMDYCDECGSTDIGSCSITEWENLYEERFKHKYIEEY